MWRVHARGPGDGQRVPAAWRRVLALCFFGGINYLLLGGVSICMIGILAYVTVQTRDAAGIIPMRDLQS